MKLVKDAPDNFAGSMSRFSGYKEQPISLSAFDIISLKDKSVSHYPIEERKAILTERVAMID